MTVAIVSALAAVVGSAVTSYATTRSLKDARDQLAIAQQGQLTDRFGRAAEQLGSPAVDVRLGAIYSLERLMKDSPSDQPAIVEILSSYIRQHAPAGAGGTHPCIDVQAVVTVLGRRRSEADSHRVVDLGGTNLSGADLRHLAFTGANLTGADLAGANLSDARLNGANLGRSKLIGADLRGADLSKADAMRADLTNADLSGANLTDADLNLARLTGASARQATLVNTSLVGTHLGRADLAEADLSGAKLNSADLSNANFLAANLTGADLSRTYLTEARLDGACLKGADLRRARLIRTGLVSTCWDETTILPPMVKLQNPACSGW